MADEEDENMAFVKQLMTTKDGIESEIKSFQEVLKTVYALWNSLFKLITKGRLLTHLARLKNNRPKMK